MGIQHTSKQCAYFTVSNMDHKKVSYKAKLSPAGIPSIGAINPSLRSGQFKMKNVKVKSFHSVFISFSSILHFAFCTLHFEIPISPRPPNPRRNLNKLRCFKLSPST